MVPQENPGRYNSASVNAIGGDDAAAEAAILRRLVDRSRELLPLWRERAPRAEELRRLPEETVRDLIDAGLPRILQPARFGGYELDYGLAQIALASEIGRACASTAWVALIFAVNGWLLGMFPDQAQQEVWAKSADALGSDALFPERSELQSVPGVLC
jgi:3-hydroxy-9,10-secoandrosta-1,3,5(10)-triene-9,17-dione monooxygenase